MGLLDIWGKTLTKPKEAFAEMKGKATFGTGAKHIAIGYLIAGAIGGLVGGLIGGAIGAVIGLIAGAIGALIVGLIVSIIGIGILYLFAKLLGGKGTFSVQYCLYAIFAAPIAIITTIVGFIPLVGGIIALLIALYSLYLLTMSIKVAHEISTMKAILVWLIPVIIIVILIGILIAAIGITFLQTFTQMPVGV